MNKALYVKLDDETWEALREKAERERRQMADQVAIMLREQLVERKQKAAA